VELLVVMSLIVILILMALPAFRFLSGGRSVEGATNVVSSTLARARADAIGVQKIRAVAFYRDTATDRSATAILDAKTPADWIAGVTYVKDTYVRVGTANPYDYYICLVANTSATANKPGTAGGAAYWRVLGATTKAALNGGTLLILDSVPDRDHALLPVGIDFKGVGNSGTYLDVGVIMFDGYGTVIARDYVIPKDGSLGTQAPLSIDATGNSQVALMVYDSEFFKSAVGSGTAADVWLNNNALPLLVNRYNGTIVKGD
jgi:hypothetical protein